MEYSISVLDALFSLRQKYGKEFLTLSEAAAELGLAYGSLRNMVSDERCPVPTVLIGKRRVIPILGIAKLTFEALTGEKVSVTFGFSGAARAAKEKEKKKPGRHRNPEPVEVTSTKEVSHG